MRESQNSFDFYLSMRARSRVENSPATWAFNGDVLRAIHRLGVASASVLLGKSCAEALSFRPERIHTFGHPSMVLAMGFDTDVFHS